ncbi:MAG: type IV pilus modification protein PilV [Steroidobacteraceae bacterium]|nr:type IV pilus modification protein PilV [Steroidobacteraceae bacterium]MDW8259552.1 type IV pilus modification protein PilV [Gammaproteobacteria bacterium]
MRRRILIQGPSRRHGMSLVESLVALVVLSVGMLGIAGLLLTGIKSNRSALYRTQAVNLVADMADRIRANANARQAYDTAVYGGAPSPHDCAPSAGGSGSNCTIQQLAEDDLARWIEAVRRALPGIGDQPAQAEVSYTAAVGGGPESYEIEVAWQEPGEVNADNTPVTYRYRSRVVLMPRPEVG